jgi:hypothetical protein
MEQDTLGHLIQLFAQLGGDAKWAFLAYLGYKAFAIVAIGGAAMTVALVGIRALRASDEDAKAMKLIGAVLGHYHYEREKMVEEIRKLKASSSTR